MAYLEECDLVSGCKYLCVPYDGSASMILVYESFGLFNNIENTESFSLCGDIRYVLHLPTPAVSDEGAN